MSAKELGFDEIRTVLGERDPNCHKGNNGKGLLLAGSPGFSGAAVMAGAAALRAGIGTLKLLCPEAISSAFYCVPELMVNGFTGGWAQLKKEKLEKMIDSADCIAAGPGMGMGEGVFPVLQSAIGSGKPLILDADALNAIALAGIETIKLHGSVILTPHLGEMSRLSGIPVSQIEADMTECALSYAKKWNCTIILKSSRSVIASRDGQCRINITGNAGLAKGGSGDVLTGLTLAMLGQGLEPFSAACAGSYLLGASADEAVAILKERMLMARDVVDVIEETINLTLGEQNGNH